MLGEIKFGENFVPIQSMIPGQNFYPAKFSCYMSIFMYYNLLLGVIIFSIVCSPILAYLARISAFIASTERGLVYPFDLKVLYSPFAAKPKGFHTGILLRGIPRTLNYCDL